MSSSNSTNQGGRNKGTGRKKTKLEKMENNYNRQVTFSKRRAGLFKKINELTTLCGAEAAVIVFSPGKKVYSYGNPSVDEIASRFDGVSTSHDRNLVEARRKANQDQISQLNGIEAQLELEKKYAKEMENMPRLNLDNLSLEELERLHEFMVNLQQKCEAHVENGMKFKDHLVPDLNLTLVKEEPLQYPKVEGSDVNVPPFIRNLMTGAARRTEMLASGNQPLASSGSSSNRGPNRPAPHFTIPFPMVGRSVVPWVQYGSGSGSGGNMEWYKGSSSSNVIPYSNVGANDEEASSSS